MKVLFKSTLILGFIALAIGCTKEPPVMTFNVTPSATDVFAGTAIDYTITGEADFITFYAGTPGSEWSEYPDNKGQNVNVRTSNVFSKVYNKQGVFTSVFVASSYGNWAEDEEVVIKEFEITVTDNRTGIADFRLITGSLLTQKEWPGEINTDNNTIVVEVDPGTSISNTKASLITDSPDAIVTVDGAEFINSKTRLNYTSPVIFDIEAPDGSKGQWTVTVTGAK